jgi:hypothetical protein
VKQMKGSQSKTNIAGIGLLSRFTLMYYYSNDVGVDARVVEDKDKIGDLKVGIEIAPNLRLRLASEEDANLMAPFLIMRETSLWFTLQNYVLECLLEVDEQELAIGYRKMVHMIRSAVLGLRLLKSDHIEANIILGVTTRGQEKQTGLTIEETIMPRLAYDYRLRIDELSEFKSLVERVLKVDLTLRKPLQIALNRFNRSYNEIESEDKLIDFMISFEALFLGGEKTRAQHAVIPVACAMLLGKSEKERQEIKSLLSQAYTIRSAVVHGLDYEKKLASMKLTLDQLVANVEDILRASLRRLI